MCLNTVDEKTYKARVGYKVFARPYNDRLRAVFRYHKIFHEGWNYDRQTGIISEGEVSYPTGFHVYARLKDAQAVHPYSDIHKVILHKVVASGTERFYHGGGFRLFRVYVARSIYIHPEEER